MSIAGRVGLGGKITTTTTKVKNTHLRRGFATSLFKGLLKHLESERLEVIRTITASLSLFLALSTPSKRFQVIQTKSKKVLPSVPLYCNRCRHAFALVTTTTGTRESTHRRALKIPLALHIWVAQKVSLHLDK